MQRPNNLWLLAGLAALSVSVAAQPAAKPKLADGATPNAERVVTIAAMDKRTGATQSFEGKPGDVFRFGNLAVVMRSCETAPPWEQRLTGAFLQIDELSARTRRRVFSGWMFAQSPSLNPLEHPRYDVWVRACAMKWPETGPDTVVVASGSRSSAPKSAETPSAPVSNDR
jgi:hypothetical protein